MVDPEHMAESGWPGWDIGVEAVEIMKRNFVDLGTSSDKDKCDLLIISFNKE